MEINSLVQIFGSAGVTFYVMWLWLQSIQLEKKGIINKLELEQENRIKELKEMLPLLNDASKGLQDVIKTNDNKNQEVIETIIKHIDDRIEMISSRCNKGWEHIVPKNELTSVIKHIDNIKKGGQYFDGFKSTLYKKDGNLISVSWKGKYFPEINGLVFIGRVTRG